MREACEGAYRERAWMCAMEMVVHMFLSPVSLLLACATVHIVFIYMIFINILSFIVSYSPPQPLSLAHTFSVILPQQQISCWPRLQAAGAGLSGPGIDPAPSRGLPFISEP